MHFAPTDEELFFLFCVELLENRNSKSRKQHSGRDILNVSSNTPLDETENSVLSVRSN